MSEVSPHSMSVEITTLNFANMCLSQTACSMSTDIFVYVSIVPANSAATFTLDRGCPTCALTVDTSLQPFQSSRSGSFGSGNTNAEPLRGLSTLTFTFMATWNLPVLAHPREHLMAEVDQYWGRYPSRHPASMCPPRLPMTNTKQQALLPIDSLTSTEGLLKASPTRAVFPQHPVLSIIAIYPKLHQTDFSERIPHQRATMPMRAIPVLTLVFALIWGTRTILLSISVLNSGSTWNFQEIQLTSICSGRRS